ncbi:MAG: YbaB/EbfC family nucleoid-associated protein [Thermincola sp.]|nr:YbaB/EbfC family nucleoid-associated protein [Thermincola sp.]MDT3703964.1 YbaB/EbfC family nucleoid-associated protein [Thermincola sp.]
MLDGELGKLLQQAQKLQSDMMKAQEDLKKLRVEEIVDAGSVRVVVNGRQEIINIVLDPGIIHPANSKILQELLVSAVNKALTKSRKLADQEVSKITGGLNIPNFPNLF